MGKYSRAEKAERFLEYVCSGSLYLVSTMFPGKPKFSILKKWAKEERWEERREELLRIIKLLYEKGTARSGLIITKKRVNENQFNRIKRILNQDITETEIFIEKIEYSKSDRGAVLELREV